MGLQIILNDQGLRQFEELLRGLSGAQATRVMADAMNKSGDKTRTQVKRELAQQSGVKYGQIDMRTIRATPTRLEYMIIQAGDETNLNLFAAKQGKRGVSARPWNQRRVFAGTFLVPGYGNKVFHRTQEARFPVEQLWGPNLAREVVKDKPAEAFEAGGTDLQQQIEAQLLRRAATGFGF